MNIIQAIQLAGFGVVDDIAKQFDNVNCADTIAKETLRLLVQRLRNVDMSQPVRDVCSNMLKTH